MEQQTLDDKLANLDKFLLEYQSKFHLDKIKVEEVDIVSTISEIKKLHPEDIAEKLLNWGIYSFAIQIKINELKAKLVWVEDNLKRYLGFQQQNISKEFAYTAEDRKLILISDDVYAYKLYKVKTDINIKLTQLQYLPKQIEFLIEISQQIANNKWREMNGQRRN